jgi:hypothetical protein
MKDIRRTFKGRQVAGVSYADDTRYGLRADARILSCDVEVEPFVEGAPDMPLAVALVRTTQKVFLEKCGLEITLVDEGSKKHKNRVIRFGRPEDTDLAEYGDTRGEHLKVVYGGTMVQGSPVGTDAYRAEKLRNTVTRKLGGTCEALVNAPTLQIRGLLNQQCGGVVPVMHALRTQADRIWRMGPTPAITVMHDLIEQELKVMVENSYLSDRVRFQMELALRMGGVGMRNGDVADAAFLGHIAAAFSSTISVVDLGPEWGELDWEQSQLPVMADVRAAWARVVSNSEHIRNMARAVQVGGLEAFGTLALGDEADEGKSPKSIMGKYHGAYDAAWKAHKLRATELGEVGEAAWERMDLDLEAYVLRKGDGSSAVREPGNHVGVFRKWIEMGDGMFQKTFSAAAKRAKFEQMEVILGQHGSGREAAAFRSVLGEWSCMPMVSLPKQDVCKWADEDYLVFVHERYLMRQPMLMPARGKRCTCGVMDAVVNEEHLESCGFNAGWKETHDELRNTLVIMCQMAGIITDCETAGLCGQGDDRRPGDVVLTRCRLTPDAVADRVAIDVAITRPDNGVRQGEESSTRITGRAAERKQKKKLEQEDRRERLREQGYEFVVLTMERNGAISSSMTKFLKNICDVAYERKKHDKGFFLHYWKVIIANIVLQGITRGRVRQVRKLVEDKTSSTLGQTRLKIQGGRMASTEAEGRLAT